MGNGVGLSPGPIILHTTTMDERLHTAAHRWLRSLAREAFRLQYFLLNSPRITADTEPGQRLVVPLPTGEGRLVVVRTIGIWEKELARQAGKRVAGEEAWLRQASAQVLATRRIHEAFRAKARDLERDIIAQLDQQKGDTPEARAHIKAQRDAVAKHQFPPVDDEYIAVATPAVYEAIRRAFLPYLRKERAAATTNGHLGLAIGLDEITSQLDALPMPDASRGYPSLLLEFQCAVPTTTTSPTYPPFADVPDPPPEITDLEPSLVWVELLRPALLSALLVLGQSYTEAMFLRFDEETRTSSPKLEYLFPWRWDLSIGDGGGDRAEHFERHELPGGAHDPHRFLGQSVLECKWIAPHQVFLRI